MPFGPDREVIFCHDCSGRGRDMGNGFALRPEMVCPVVYNDRKTGEEPDDMLGIAFFDKASGAEGGAIVGMSGEAQASDVAANFGANVLGRIAICPEGRLMEPFSGCRALPAEELDKLAKKRD